MDFKGKNIVDFADARQNLRRKKKDDAREAKERQAAENRAKFGRTGAQKKQDKLERLKQADAHADHKRQDSKHQDSKHQDSKHQNKKSDSEETDKHE
ncbi:MAG: DUF4169 family protein [Parvibaculum sp.]